MDSKGCFICIEGLDGCGKTTQSKLLVRKLRQKKIDAVCTAEPTRGKIGRLIKEYCLHREKRGSVVVEALLFAADRFEHVEGEILPALNAGKVAVSDRYVYSSLAYQGAAGLDVDWIELINRHAVKPHLAIFLDVDPSTVMRRLKRKKSVMENLETQLKVRGLYLRFVDKGELIRIDGNKLKAQVANDILNAVLKRLKTV